MTRTILKMFSGRAFLAFVSVVSLGACRAVSEPQRCQKHGTLLELRSGYVIPPPYRIFPTEEYFEIIEENPHYDRGLLYERKDAPVGSYTHLQEDWVCPECVRNGSQYLARAYK